MIHQNEVHSCVQASPDRLILLQLSNDLAFHKRLEYEL